MAGDIKLKIGADTSDLEKAFSTLIKKIQGDADKLKIAPASKASGAAAGGPGSQPFQQAFQASRAQAQKTRDEKDGIEIATRALSQKKRQIDEIAKAESASVGNKKQEVYWADKRNKAEKEYNDLIAARKRLDRSGGGGGGGGAGDGSGGAGGGGGSGRGRAGIIPQGGITSVSGLASFLGIPGAMIGAAATGLAIGAAAEPVRKYFSEASYRAREVEASAFQTQGQGGQRIQSFLNGGAAEETLFNPLRMQAQKLAEEQMKGRMESSFRIFSRPLQTIMGRANNGYETGNQFGFGTDSIKKKIDAEQQQERASLQASQFEALKSGPEGALRTAVGNKYLKDYQRNLDFQRQTGLSTEGFRGAGGFLPGIQNAGFTDEQGMGMASGIIGAGGSTRAATGSSTMALQAQRNLDMTNAGSVLGKLSGSLGSSGTSNEAFVKILAEGTKIGLDGSEYREENRRFVETAAQMVAQSGTTSSAGVDQILSQFGKFFGGDRTNTGIEAGKNAFELYRQTSMATTGPRATMRAAGMLTDPTVSRLDRDSREALFNMPIDQLTPDNPAIVAMAAQAGTTPEELIKAQNKITSKSANLFKNSDMATKRLADIKKKYNRQSAIDMTGPFAPGEQEEITKALGESNIAQIKEHPELGQNQRLASQYSEGLSAGDTQMQNKALEEAKKQQIEKPTSGRPEDETNRLQAEASRLANQMFVSLKESIVPASDAAAKLAADINTLTAAMKGGSPSQISTALQNFQSAQPGMAPSNQPTAGAPASGGGSTPNVGSP